MEEAEPSRYVTQLRAEFDGCDSTATGFLDREQLTELSRKLQLDQHLPLLLDTLLGGRRHGRVNFDEFKNGLVVVLSHSLDFSTSEDDSSYLEPGVPQEVKPKFVKGAKRYGRRSRPETQPGTGLDSTPTRTKPVDLTLDSPPPGVRRAKLRRSTSLESMESLKSDEETGSSRTDQQLLHNKADQQQQEAAGSDVAAGCDHLDLQERLDANREANLDASQDGRVAIRKVLWSSAPTLSSTPIRSADLQRAPLWNKQLVPDGPVRSLLSLAAVGPRVLTRLDDGSGSTSPERVAALWAEAGIRNSQQILQSLDFPMEERLSLSDLVLVLDNELLLSTNSVHQAALVSYRTEIQHLQEAVEQLSRERDKLRSDLDRADQQNLQLVREADERLAGLEALQQNRTRDLESDLRRRVAALQQQAEQENEALLQQGERERSAAQQQLQQLQHLRAKEAELQEELEARKQENQRLQQELGALQAALRESAGSVQRLQTDLDQLLLHKLGGLDPAGAGLSHEERFCELLRESQRQCRELQDRNDELLEAQRSSRRSTEPPGGDGSQRHAAGDPDMRSIQSELMLQQLKENHQEALQQLHIQLDSQMNFYERQLDLMRQNMEVERKDISQAYKVEISELEEQKVQLEQQLKAALTRLQNQEGAGLSAAQQRRAQWERAELEQNYATEISNLVQKLSAEKEQLEAELKLQAQQEVMRLRAQLEAVRSENAAQQERLKVLQQTVQNLEDESEKRRRRQQEVEEERERSREEEERLRRENSRYREEVLDLSGRNLQLSSDNGDLSNRLHGEQETVRMLRQRLATVTNEQGEEVRRLEAELSGLKAELQKVEEEREELQKRYVRLVQ